jgi:hypothetical protein
MTLAAKHTAAADEHLAMAGKNAGRRCGIFGACRVK